MNFAEVERVAAKLRRDVAAGQLTEEQLKARLKEMMVQDEQGTWWMVGYQTGEWYRHDGTDWVPDRPPGLPATRPVSPEPSRQTERPLAGWAFWFPWVLVTAVGGGVGGILGGGVNGFIGELANGAVGWAVVGACIGVAQWLLLLGRIRRAAWWIPASVVGWVVGAPLSGPLFGPQLGYAACGALIGFLQWPVLRGQVRSAGAWVVASTLCWGVGGLVGWWVSFVVLETIIGASFWGFALGWAAGWTLGGAAAGAISGIPLIWLLRRPV